MENRERVIVRTSIIGILVNIALAGFKGFVGIVSNSVAVTMDAVNNLTDALSSVVTIVGTKLAGKEPDKKHPLGYGRIEYLTTMVIAAIVLYAGITAFTESVQKIIEPVIADYSAVALTIIGVAVIVKILLGLYFTKVGKKVNSGSLVASGKDALFDALLSASVFLSAVIFILWDLSLEAYVGILIAVFIIRSGIEILRDTLDEILGKRVEKEFSDSVKSTICEDPDVTGAYDLILHSYGPDRYIGSVHVEVPDTMDASSIDDMERRIAAEVYRRHGIIMAGIGIYSVNTKDDDVIRMRTEITRMVMSHEGVLQMHGLRIRPDERSVVFDIIIDYSIKDRASLYDEICREVSEAFPDHTVRITMDVDI